jgi:ElaA protein
VQIAWYGFADLPAPLLYEALLFRQAIFVVEQHSPYPDLDGLDQRAQHLLLSIDGALAGYLRLIPYPDEARVAIGRVAVAAPLRRRGLARRLTAEAIARCRRDHPGSTIALSAQSYLAPFYETLGFRPISAPYDDYGVPHIDMEMVP